MLMQKSDGFEENVSTAILEHIFLEFQIPLSSPSNNFDDNFS